MKPLYTGKGSVYAYRRELRRKFSRWFVQMTGSVALVTTATTFGGCSAAVNQSEHQARRQLADYSGWIGAKAESGDEEIPSAGVLHAGSTPVWRPLTSTDEIVLATPAFTVVFQSQNILGTEVKFTDGAGSALSGIDDESTLLQVSMPIQRGRSGCPVIPDQGRVLGVMEASVEKDNDGNPMQLTNLARNAPVAALLIDKQTREPRNSSAHQCHIIIERCKKAVCKVSST